MSGIPQYLERPRDGVQTFGVLSRGTDNLWTINGDPQVVQFAKRLFPGSEGRGRGYAKFPATRRTFADLVWLMQRWPLEIAAESLKQWEQEYAAACDYVVARDEFNTKPMRATAGVLFTGELRPYQDEGLAWLQQFRRTLLADEMGLGKTVEVLALIATTDDWPVLIVVPPHLQLQWQQKISEFLKTSESLGPLFSDGLQVHTLAGRKPYALPESDIYICHYLILAAWRRHLLAQGIKGVIFEEVQELRRKESQKYSAAHEIAQEAEYVVGVSGTPIYNRGGEIWNILNVIEMHCLGDWDSFTREWCNGYGSDTVVDPELLGQHLRREGLMLRRTKREVLPQLPPKSRIVQILDHDHQLFSELIREAVRLARSATVESDVLKRGRIEREAVEESRKATGLAKVHSAIAFLIGLIEAGEAPLIFAHHHAVVDALVEGLAKYAPVVISGRQTAIEKDHAKTEFIEGRSQACIISLRSAAGLDGFQYRSRVVVFVELDWSPAVHSQAEDRLDRDGQVDAVTAYYLVITAGSDPDLQEALGFKISQSTGIMGDKPDDDELLASRARTHMQSVVVRLREMAA